MDTDKTNNNNKDKSEFLKFIKTKKAKLLNEPIYYEDDDFDKKNPFKLLAKENKVFLKIKYFFKILNFKFLKKYFI